MGLFIILGYFTLCFALVLLGNEDSGVLPTTAKDINYYKILQVIFATVLFILPATIFCRYMRDERNAFLNMNTPPRFYYALTAGACILFAFPAVEGLQSWNQLIHLPSSFSSTEEWMRVKENAAEKITLMFFQDKSIGGLVINLLVMAFVAALSEEIFFRGLLQQMLIKNKINAHVAIVITAILFSAFHLQFFGFIPRLFLGIVLGYLYYITQNLWVSVIAHFCNNAVAVVNIHLYSQESVSDVANPTTTDQLIQIAFVLLSIAMVIGQLVMLKRFANKINTIQ